jgi:UDP-3-O-[3-hydroxymyristoyl] N-acetylglucosamine deacetylase/3-hydroxyacyl-[acyl-carrier-protein] dehydratase
MPGVLQIEAMVQTGGVLVLHKMADPHLYSTYFLSIENCRFKKKVLPGDSLIIHCELISDIKLGIVKMRGRAFVGNSMVCEATMVAKIAKKND